MLSPLQLSSLMPECEEEIGSWWLRQRRRVDSASRPVFDSADRLSIWKERNCRVFGRPASSVQLVVNAAFKEGEERAMAGFAPLSVLSAIWSQNESVM